MTEISGEKHFLFYVSSSQNRNLNNKDYFLNTYNSNMMKDNVSLL